MKQRIYAYNISLTREYLFDRGADNNLFIVLKSKMSIVATWRRYHMFMAHLF